VLWFLLRVKREISVCAGMTTFVKYSNIIDGNLYLNCSSVVVNRHSSVGLYMIKVAWTFVTVLMTHLRLFGLFCSAINIHVAVYYFFYFIFFFSICFVWLYSAFVVYKLHISEPSRSAAYLLYSADSKHYVGLLQYSTWSLTSILYELSITLVFLNLIVLLIIPKTLVALLKVYIHCLKHFIWDDTHRPTHKSFS